MNPASLNCQPRAFQDGTESAQNIKTSCGPVGHGTSERQRKIDRLQACVECLEDKLWDKGSRVLSS